MLLTPPPCSLHLLPSVSYSTFSLARTIKIHHTIQTHINHKRYITNVNHHSHYSLSCALASYFSSSSFHTPRSFHSSTFSLSHSHPMTDTTTTSQEENQKISQKYIQQLREIHSNIQRICNTDHINVSQLLMNEFHAATNVHPQHILTS